MSGTPDDLGARPPQVMNLEAVAAAYQESPDGRFAVLRKQLGAATGAEKLGCSWIEIPPGKRAWPHHWHWGNEEAIFVLHGEGTLRLGEATMPIGPGDYIACPANPDGAHQLHNTGTESLRCLLLSTMISPDITVYPDSNKIGVYAGSAPGGPPDQRQMNMFLPTGGYVDYWHGESDPDA